MPVQITLPDDLVADIRRGTSGVVEQLRTLLAEPEAAIWRISRESIGFDTMDFTHDATGVSVIVSLTEIAWGARLPIGQVLVIPYNDGDTLFRVTSVAQSIGREHYPSTVVVRAESINGRALVVASGDTVIHRDEEAAPEEQGEPIEDVGTEDDILMHLFERDDTTPSPAPLPPPRMNGPLPEPEAPQTEKPATVWRRMRLV